MSVFFLFFCIYFASIAVATPCAVPLYARQDAKPESSFVDDIAHAINTTVTDHAGNDITSAFEIMVFYDPSAPPNNTLPTNDTLPTNGNSTDSLIGRRQTALYRQITYCHTPRSTFVSSECTPINNKRGSLQGYTVTCNRIENIFHPYTAKFLYSTSVPVRRDGHCWSDEICINAVGLGDEMFKNFGLKYANCVNRRAFYAVKPPIGLKLDYPGVMDSFEGKRLSMVVSKEDESTPLEVDTFDVEAEIAGDGNGKAGEVDKCRDCMDLETKQFRKGTESLKAEVRMLTTGAVAGVLWLALMSG